MAKAIVKAATCKTVLRIVFYSFSDMNQSSNLAELLWDAESLLSELPRVMILTY
jgi:hypothetical protein